MADALVSPTVAGVAGAGAIALIAVASRKVKNIKREDIVPLMGVMGAFVFAAQMINFAIPGTGSSGHIIGGVLLTALLGPWAAFITLCSVLIIQCLIFADGGMMALGCNIINMAAMSCLVATPLLYRPIAGNSTHIWKIWTGAIVASIVGLELGALLVSAETELSGITSLPFSTFYGLLASIHLVIGLIEGIATAFILSFVASYYPEMFYSRESDIGNYKDNRGSGRMRKALIWFGAFALIMAAGFTWLASENPDGLEWSIERITGTTEIGENLIPSTAIMPDYDSTFAGIIGGLIVMVMIWSICAILFRKRKAS